MRVSRVRPRRHASPPLPRCSLRSPSARSFAGQGHLAVLRVPVPWASPVASWVESRPIDRVGPICAGSRFREGFALALLVHGRRRICAGVDMRRSGYVPSGYVPDGIGPATVVVEVQYVPERSGTCRVTRFGKQVSEGPQPRPILRGLFPLSLGMAVSCSGSTKEATAPRSSRAEEGVRGPRAR